jgi:Ca-activated chloride channel family protein
VFVFGEGFDVNTKLLDFLALNNRGEADYILPTENIADKISRFFDRVGSPIMTDLKVEFEGLEVKDVFPRKINDVFRREQVIIYGRYTGHGDKTIKITGTVKGETKTFTYKLNFPEYSETDKASFVPRLWAGKKVDYLLNEIRKSPDMKPGKELVDEVTYLAKRYGIITPYTSFLVTDDIATRPGTVLNGKGGLPGAGGPSAVFNNNRGRREVLESLNKEKASAPASDSKIVLNAKKRADLRKMTASSGGAAAFGRAIDGLLAERDEAKGKPGAKRSSLAALRYIGSTTFYKYGSVWIDGRFEPEKHTKGLKSVKVGSKEYFDLLKQDVRLAKYLALGDVVVRVKTTWYRIETAKPAKKKILER